MNDLPPELEELFGKLSKKKKTKEEKNIDDLLNLCEKIKKD